VLIFSEPKIYRIANERGIDYENWIFTASLVLALFMSQVSLPVWGTTMAWADVKKHVKRIL
jgi:hypothetical protein